MPGPVPAGSGRATGSTLYPSCAGLPKVWTPPRHAPLASAADKPSQQSGSPIACSSAGAHVLALDMAGIPRVYTQHGWVTAARADGTAILVDGATQRPLVTKHAASPVMAAGGADGVDSFDSFDSFGTGFGSLLQEPEPEPRPEPRSAAAADDDDAVGFLLDLS